jgi:glycosyltransferase involved in cell wall biosynthesis
MKILHVTPTYVPAWRYGGPIRSVHGLCAGLVRLGAEVDVYTTSVDGPDNLAVPADEPVDLDGVGVRYFRSTLLRRLYFAPAMGAALRSEIGRYDLVHLHSIYLWPTWKAAREARAQGVPYVLSPRGMLVKALIERRSAFTKNAWIALAERRNIECAAAIHATSETEAQDLRQFGMRLPELIVVPNGVSREAEDGAMLPPSIEAVLRERQPVVLYLGRISWKKGLDRLIKALPLVPGATLLVAGNDEDGYAEDLRALAGEMGVIDRLVFAGVVHGSAKLELFRRAALLVLPSYSENFGNVVLEAMAERCAVLVTREVGLASVVADAAAGLVVDGEPVDIAGGISRLLADAALRSAMGRAGQARVAAEYTWDMVARRMLEHYRVIADRRAVDGPTGQAT